jgi:hypothetical protein
MKEIKVHIFYISFYLLAALCFGILYYRQHLEWRDSFEKDAALYSALYQELRESRMRLGECRQKYIWVTEERGKCEAELIRCQSKNTGYQRGFDTLTGVCIDWVEEIGDNN